MKKVVFVISLIALTSCSLKNSSPSNYDKPSIKIINGENCSENDIIINMAVCDYENWIYGSDAITQFNKLDNGYHINIIDYRDFYDMNFYDENKAICEAYVDADQQVVYDIINKNNIDMVMSLMTEDKILSLANKGAFVDLNQFIEKDSEINRDILNRHVLDICEVDNKLYYMPFSYTVDTLYGYEKNIGHKENWNIDEMISCWKKMPDNSSFTNVRSSNTSDAIFDNLCMNCIPAFIDTLGRNNRFDSEEFIKLLKFANEFDKEDFVDKQEKTIDSFFLAPTEIKSFEQFHEIMINHNVPETLSFVGYPSLNNSYSFIVPSTEIEICSKANYEVQQGAWEFIRFLVSETYQYEAIFNNADHYMSFPINEKAFEKRGTELLAVGNDRQTKNINDSSLYIGNITRKEYDQLCDIINNTNYLRFGNTDIFRIIFEEVDLMFSNEQTPEKTAANIQNRVSILLNE